MIPKSGLTESQTEFTTGAKRSTLDDVRFDLICPLALKRLAIRYAMGAQRYGEWNWTKGIPIGNLLNHIKAHLNHFELTPDDDDDLAAAAWGIFAIMHFQGECTHAESTQDRESRWAVIGRVGSKQEGSEFHGHSGTGSPVLPGDVPKD